MVSTRRVCILVSVFGMLVSAGLARTPGFDPKDVVRRVRSRGIEGAAPDRFQPSAGSREPFALNGEFLIDTSITPVPSPCDQREPAVAFDGVNFLVVWRDDRGGGYDYSDIYGARVTLQGTVLDPGGIAISQAAGGQFSPALAFDGANFLVVWHDYLHGIYSDICGARVTPQGTVLDPSGFVVSQGGAEPAVSFDGANFLVVWENGGVRGTRVTPQGTVLDSAGFVISVTEYSVSPPAIAFGGGEFLVAWDDNRGVTECDIYGARVTPQGVVLDSAGIVISHTTSDEFYPALSFDGANFLVAWQVSDVSASDIYGARVTSAGEVLDPAGIAISRAANEQYTPVVGFDGANFLVTWLDCRSGWDIYGARVTPQGTVLDPAGTAISQAANGQGSPAIGFDGANFLVVWADCRSGSYGDIYGARVTPEGLVLDTTGIAISIATDHQAFPVLALDGAGFLTVWEDYRNGNADVYGSRVTSQGAVLDPARHRHLAGGRRPVRPCRGL